MLPHVVLTAPLIVLTLLGAALRFYGIGHQGFWYDEAYTVVLTKLSLGRMLGQLPHQESTPPLYYCIAWLWTRIFGHGTASLKSLSALFGTAVIPVSYAAAAKLLHGRRAALTAAALTACSPLLIWYSQEARAYELLVLVSALTLLSFAYARERPRPLALTLWALSAALALTTHYYSILVVAPEAAWLLYEHRRRRALYAALGAVTLTGLALLPLLIVQNQTGNDAWIGNSPLSLRLDQVIPLFLIGPQTPARTVLKFIAFACALAALVLLARATRRRERQGAMLPGGIALAGLALSLLVIPLSDTFLGRNLLALWVPAALALAAGLAAARARLLGAALTVALCAIGVVATIGVATNYDMQRPNWQPVGRLIGPPPRSGTRLVLLLRNPGLLPLGLYVSRLRYADANAFHDVSQIDVIAVRDIPGLGGFCWWGSACNLSPGTLPQSEWVRGFHPVWRRSVEQFSVLELASPRPRSVTRDAVGLMVRHELLTNDTLLLQS